MRVHSWKEGTVEPPEPPSPPAPPVEVVSELLQAASTTLKIARRPIDEVHVREVGMRILYTIARIKRPVSTMTHSRLSLNTRVRFGT